MKNNSRLFRVVGAVALLVSMLAATVAPTAAQVGDELEQDWLDSLIGNANAEFLAGNNSIYYPWVANGDDFGLGDSVTSISVQNLEGRDTVISIYAGDGAGGFDLVTSAHLSAFASKTFTAAQLGIAAGTGAPVAVVSFNETSFDIVPGFVVPDGTVALAESTIILSNPITAEDEGGESTQVLACVVNYHTAAQPDLGVPYGYVAAVQHTFNGTTYAAGAWVSFDGVSNVQSALQDALNDAQVDGFELVNPFGGLNADGDCFDVLDAVTITINDSVAIGGTALQTATAVAPGNGDDDAELEQFVTTHTATSGYNAVNGAELYYFGEWYLPIVQTNVGPGGAWDSMIRIGNFSDLNNAVTVRFFPADDGSGSLQTGFQLQQLVDGGSTWNINLGDYVPEGWVGTAHILSDGAVFAMVDRYKVGYNMWITNTGSSADFEAVSQLPSAQGRYALFAPHVLMDYFGWNTGINVANLVNADNNVSIQYFNLLGNATQVLNQRLAPHGMTYFYDPSVAAQNVSEQDVETDPNAGVVGSAIIWSDHPVAAAVDATKYPETDPSGGADLFQATSYNATQNIFQWQAVPYVTKGNPTDGSGATSGINIMNPNATATTATVYFVNPSGFNAQNFGTSSVTIPGFANGFVYTLWQHNLPNGFTGAAQVIADLPVAAVSANVNYDVDGDGSAIFNAFNPCGLYRSVYPCSFGVDLIPAGQDVTITFVEADEAASLDQVDEDDSGIAGVQFSIFSTTDANYQRDGVSGEDGTVTLPNVPVGTYELVINAVPAGYVLPSGVAATFEVTGDGGVYIVITLERVADAPGADTFVFNFFVACDTDDVQETVPANSLDDIHVCWPGTDVIVDIADLDIYLDVEDDWMFFTFDGNGQVILTEEDVEFGVTYDFEAEYGGCGDYIDGCDDYYFDGTVTITAGGSIDIVLSQDDEDTNDPEGSFTFTFLVDCSTGEGDVQETVPANSLDDVHVCWPNGEYTELPIAEVVLEVDDDNLLEFDFDESGQVVLDEDDIEFGVTYSLEAFYGGCPDQSADGCDDYDTEGTVTIEAGGSIEIVLTHESYDPSFTFNIMIDCSTGPGDVQDVVAANSLDGFQVCWPESDYSVEFAGLALALHPDDLDPSKNEPDGFIGFIFDFDENGQVIIDEDSDIEFGEEYHFRAAYGGCLVDGVEPVPCDGYLAEGSVTIEQGGTRDVTLVNIVAIGPMTFPPGGEINSILPQESGDPGEP